MYSTWSRKVHLPPGQGLGFQVDGTRAPSPLASVCGSWRSDISTGEAYCPLATSVRIETMLWKHGVDRMPPFHQFEYCENPSAPVLPSCSRRCWMPTPSIVMPRLINGCMFGFTGSSIGGVQMRGDVIPDWCW